MGNGKLNGALRIRILERDGYACVYCGRRPPQVALEVDHVLPRARGGRDEAINLVTACFDCNNGKSDHLVAVPDTVVLAPLPILPAAARPRSPAHRSGWLREAELRWPEGVDFGWIEGRGRWATVAWCTILTIGLHSTANYAADTFARLLSDVCGHGCWHDHELIDLAVPQRLTTVIERIRGAKRIAHFRECPTCTAVTHDWGTHAAWDRMDDRLMLASA